MAILNKSYANASSAVHGVPAFEVLDTFIDSNLVAGAEPAIQQPRRVLLGDSLTFPQFAVVGLSGGRLVWATYNANVANAVKPIGVLMQPATSGANNTTIAGEMSPTGCFNAGADDAGTDSPLVWDASFDTLDKKTRWEGVLGNAMLLFRRRISNV